jgi:HlyD family secretion protein
MKKTWIGWSVLFLLVGLNICLLVKKDSPITSYSFISEWDEVKIRELEQIVSTKGKVTPADEYHIYFDERKGSFEQFLVDEEEFVQSGDPLFQYRTDDTDDITLQLQERMDQLEKEADSLEEFIEELEDILDEQEANEETNTGTKVALQTEIFQKQHELNVIEAEIDSLENQLISLNGNETIITEQSPVDGIIRSINYSLTNPIMTIIADEPVVKGNVQEAELEQLEKGMTVRVKLDNETTVEGTVTAVSPFPEEKEGKLMYPVTVQLNDVDDMELPFGKKVNMEIITATAPSVMSVHLSSVNNGKNHAFVWTMNGKGQAVKHPVTLGLETETYVAVEDGLSENQLVVANPEKVQENKSPVLFPHTKIDPIFKKSTYKKEHWKYVVYGFLGTNRLP